MYNQSSFTVPGPSHMQKLSASHPWFYFFVTLLCDVLLTPVRPQHPAPLDQLSCGLLNQYLID